jgi:hypothetical protein
MAQPKTRKSGIQAMPTAADLQPAPDNGMPYVSAGARPQPAKKTATTGKVKVRDYPQLSTRVPPVLMERVQRCIDETGVSLSFLVRQGLEREVKNRGY